MHMLSRKKLASSGRHQEFQEGSVRLGISFLHSLGIKSNRFCFPKQTVLFDGLLLSTSAACCPWVSDFANLVFVQCFQQRVQAPPFFRLASPFHRRRVRSRASLEVASEGSRWRAGTLNLPSRECYPGGARPGQVSGAGGSLHEAAACPGVHPL